MLVGPQDNRTRENVVGDVRLQGFRHLLRGRPALSRDCRTQKSPEEQSREQHIRNRQGLQFRSHVPRSLDRYPWPSIARTQETQEIAAIQPVDPDEVNSTALIFAHCRELCPPHKRITQLEQTLASNGN